MSDLQQHFKPLGPQTDLSIDTDNHTCKPHDCDKSCGISILLYFGWISRGVSFRWAEMFGVRFRTPCNFTRKLQIYAYMQFVK